MCSFCATLDAKHCLPGTIDIIPISPLNDSKKSPMSHVLFPSLHITLFRIHLFIQYIFIVYLVYIPGIVLGSWDSSVNKKDRRGSLFL